MVVALPVVSQRNNYLNNHGPVFRSSATFYAISNSKLNTIISCLDYFKHKNHLVVSFVITLRYMDGSIAVRQLGDFTSSVINFDISQFFTEFEGSFEIEFFSNVDLKIPFSAVIGYYISDTTVTAVHTYGRNLNSYEKESGYPLTLSNEANFTLRDNSHIKSFFVLHNGSSAVDLTNSSLEFINHNLERVTLNVSLGILAPYESIKVYLSDHFLELSDFVGGKYASCSVSIATGGAFTRLLVGNEDLDSGAIQVTHSNFDYSKVLSDMCNPGQKMYMTLPNFKSDFQQKLVLFPTSNIKFAFLSISSADSSGLSIYTKKVNLSAADLPQEVVLDPSAMFYEISIEPQIDLEPLPTRIPFGVCTTRSSDSLHSEMSLGGYTKLRPKKRFHWIHFMNSPVNSISTVLYSTSIKDLYGPPPKDIICRVYTSKSSEFSECTINYTELKSGLPIERLMEKCSLSNETCLGYASFFSEYGGLMIYSCIISSTGDCSIEHSF